MGHFNEAEIPDGTPPEIIEHLKRQAMASEAAVNEVVTFIRELQVEQLLTLSKMLHFMTHSSVGPMVATHYEAWCDAALTFVHNRCHICGADHAQEFLDGINPHPEGKIGHAHAQQAAVSPLEEFGETKLPPVPDNIDRQWDYPAGVEPFLTHEQTAIMQSHNLVDAYVVEEKIGAPPVTTFVGFYCIGCKMQYVSPADRALKGPDDCHGCHMKSAHG